MREVRSVVLEKFTSERGVRMKTLPNTDKASRAVMTCIGDGSFDYKAIRNGTMDENWTTITDRFFEIVLQDNKLEYQVRLAPNSD